MCGYWREKIMFLFANCLYFCIVYIHEFRLFVTLNNQRPEGELVSLARIVKKREKKKRERRFYLFITLKTLPTFITAHHLVKTVTYKLIVYLILCLTPRKQHCMFELDTVLCLMRYGIDIIFVSQHQFVL